MLELDLTDETLIKTGGYRRHTRKTARNRPLLDPDKLQRIENDVSFNYSQAVFTNDLGVGGDRD
jgi:hypothetical protein